jgi:hypothetical protein
MPLKDISNTWMLKKKKEAEDLYCNFDDDQECQKESPLNNKTKERY